VLINRNLQITIEEASMIETDLILGLLAVALLAGSAFALSARLLGKKPGPSFFAGAGVALAALIAMLRRQR
jgi:hypothetical protein